MTTREDYYFTKVIESYNELIINFKLLAIERDTLLEEIKSLKEELFKSYQEISNLKGFAPINPGLEEISKTLAI